ncbi:unnamed protein product [Nesidiocoris tenuis]|uniref:Uncharacterized protein n=1 Tax=Nesidiocoris tenuis TaxID=355587 RepID=A0A6H5G044_9HEMI|nr:unnamed protein product [Nesidiocoris tenuis]
MYLPIAGAHFCSRSSEESSSSSDPRFGGDFSLESHQLETSCLQSRSHTSRPSGMSMKPRRSTAVDGSTSRHKANNPYVNRNVLDELGQSWTSPNSPLRAWAVLDESGQSWTSPDSSGRVRTVLDESGQS